MLRVFVRKVLNLNELFLLSDYLNVERVADAYLIAEDFWRRFGIAIIRCFQKGNDETNCLALIRPF